MKKIFCLLSLMCGTSFAASGVNLAAEKFTCNQQVLTSASSESMITANCKNVTVKVSDEVVAGYNATKVSGGGSDQIQDDDATPQDVHYTKISFTADNNQKLRCYFKNGSLQRCKKLRNKLTTSQAK